MYFELTLISYIIDRIFGEFGSIKHPVVFMGDFISWFEKKFYKDSIFRGSLLTFSLLIIIFIISYSLSFLPCYILAIFASTGIASKMLYESVKDIIQNPQNIKYLVSRDTKELNSSDINKAGIETYGENLSDGVIAPIFYLLLFGIVGIAIYKGINTLDSMVGYRDKRYENFGKISAKLDDIANYIPSRITALLITLLFFSLNSLKAIKDFAHLHESPNAGYPISALAGAIGVKLGGDTSYFGKIKKKSYFGYGKTEILSQDIQKAIALQIRIDIFIILSLFFCLGL
ncbi:MAG: cobalamin biosynthesis protein CobD [Arcobacteraceae bacterium]|nr:cobalamin biosynthesis protein CobD [Arcobacteraceae bacterium]